jgi:GntR family transcriptional regulator, transcriptional repressor for pyruvate dehydrogenase complex
MAARPEARLTRTSRTQADARRGEGTDTKGRSNHGRALPQEVAREIEGLVKSKRFPAGSQLPSERELAIRLGTSRNVLREALRIIETRGLVVVRHGIGTFVTDLASPENLTIPVQMRLEASRLPVEEIFLARRTIECAITEVAAQERNEFDLQDLRSLLEATAKAEATRRGPAFIEADLEFHDLIGRCTHNPLLQDIQSEVTRATAAVRGIASTTRDSMRSALRFHGEIVDAIARKDGPVARAVMLIHLIDAGERVLGALSGTGGVSGEGPDGVAVAETPRVQRS